MHLDPRDTSGPAPRLRTLALLGMLIAGLSIVILGLASGGRARSQTPLPAPATDTTPPPSPIAQAAAPANSPYCHGGGGGNVQPPAGCLDSTGDTSTADTSTDSTVDASDPTVQAVLHFTDSCGSGPRDNLPIAQLVEEQDNLYDWIGSESYPGTFSTAPAAHGGTIVTWTLPDHRAYQYTISEDHDYLSYDNDNAVGTSCLMSKLVR
jgi:hypothetical protein